VEAIKNEIGNTPLIVKIAYFKDKDTLAKLLDLVGKSVEAIEAVNTIPAPILGEDGKSAFPDGRKVSGVCGAGIKWAGLEMVSCLKDLREQKDLKYAIIGVGGVMNAVDYQEFVSAGADAVMSATGAMWNSFLSQEIKKVISAKGGSAFGGKK
jgi:dihydroorotate dehydrogenase (NAD+) catalytic subunit